MNYYTGRSFSDMTNKNSLAHYQRKGAKWGVMHGPPYPLDRQTVKDAYGSSAKPAKDAPEEKSEENKQNPKSGSNFKDTVKNQYKNRIHREQQQKKIYEVFENNHGNYGGNKAAEKIFDIVGANKEKLEQAIAVLKKDGEREKEVTKQFDEMFSKFEKDEKEFIRSEVVSELADTMLYASGKYGDDLKMTLSDLSDASFMGIFEDGQQGTINAYSMYAYKNGLGEKANSLLIKSTDDRHDAETKAMTIIDDALKEVGASKFRANPRTSAFPLSDHIVTLLAISDDNGYDWENTRGTSYLDMAHHAKAFSENGEKKFIEYSEKVVSKVKNNGDENTWRFFNEAIENLGVKDAEIDSLSQTDWDRINSEIKKLKEKE